LKQGPAGVPLRTGVRLGRGLGTTWVGLPTGGTSAVALSASRLSAKHGIIYRP